MSETMCVPFLNKSMLDLHLEAAHMFVRKQLVSGPFKRQLVAPRDSPPSPHEKPQIRLLEDLSESADTEVNFLTIYSCVK